MLELKFQELQYEKLKSAVIAAKCVSKGSWRAGSPPICITAGSNVVKSILKCV